MKHYRIGDFAHFLGVTADFLKHYENAGLLDVQQQESGYRYYPFDQSGRIYEYLRLRNYGVTLREMPQLLTGGVEEVFGHLDEKIKALEAEKARLASVTEEHERLRGWYEKRREKPFDWEIKNIEPYIFLPHTDGYDFRRDEAVHELLKVWGVWLPVVKSALSVAPAGESTDGLHEIHWGFAVPESILTSYRIPVNGAVERLVFGKAFVYHFCGLPAAFDMASVAEGRHAGLQLMRELGFVAAGTGLLVNEMQIAGKDGGAREGVGRLIVPIEAA